MIALYAFITDLPPNFFYFLKELSLTRLIFLPNVLTNIYNDPIGYTDSIPVRVIEVDSKLSFSVNAGSYLFLVFIYFGVGLIIYLVSRKFNSNRPLREVFEKIYHIRVKWSIIWDVLWIFSLNIFFCGFMTSKYP